MGDESDLESWVGNPPQEVLDHLAAYGYTLLQRWIHSQRIYEKCRGNKPFIVPTSDDLETLRRSPEDRHALACDTVLKFLENPVKALSDWDERKGAALKTYYVGGLLQTFPRVFETWQKARRPGFPRCDTPVDAQPAEGTYGDPASRVMTRDALERALRASEPEVGVIVTLVAAGTPRRDIADRLGISERAVEGRLYRVRRMMRNGQTGAGT
ncbi:hypothetical protein ACIBKX_08150 [Streptomyces sp. NPDC050658]|uniref:hypothetical protein n=1 Tax=unclassified Streptomyces TaxID=2593676 RepID=UPI00342CF4EF